MLAQKCFVRISLEMEMLFGLKLEKLDCFLLHEAQALCLSLYTTYVYGIVWHEPFARNLPKTRTLQLHKDEENMEQTAKIAPECLYYVQHRHGQSDIGLNDCYMVHITNMM